MFSSGFIGKKIAARAEMSTVRMIVRVPSDSSDNSGNLEKQKLAAKLIITNPPIILFFLEGGIIK